MHVISYKLYSLNLTKSTLIIVNMVNIKVILYTYPSIKITDPTYIGVQLLYCITSETNALIMMYRKFI